MERNQSDWRRTDRRRIRAIRDRLRMAYGKPELEPHRAPVDDLRDLEVRVDLGLDFDQLALPAQQLDPVAQIARGHGMSLRE